MKICQVIPSLGFGGAEREVVRLVKKLKDAGDDCEVVCVCEEGHLAGELREYGVAVTVLGCGKNPGIAGLLRLVSYLRASRPDVVHSHLLIWAPLAGKLAGVPAVLNTEHGLSLWRTGSLVIIDRFVARFTDRIVVVAKAVFEARRKRWKIPSEKLVFIPNSVDYRRFDFEVDTNELRQELGLNPDDRLVVAVGHLTGVKGHKYLLEAAVRVLEHQRNVCFALVGDGPLLDELKTQARGLGIDEHIRFLGYREDVEGILKSADLFVMSSLREGTSIAILEAMSAGVPVVATAVGGNPEVIRDGESGLLVPSEDPDALGKGILRVLSSPELASSFRIAARTRVEEEYSADKNLQRLRDLYREILEGSRRCRS